MNSTTQDAAQATIVKLARGPVSEIRLQLVNWISGYANEMGGHRLEELEELRADYRDRGLILPRESDVIRSFIRTAEKLNPTTA